MKIPQVEADRNLSQLLTSLPRKSHILWSDSRFDDLPRTTTALHINKCRKQSLAFSLESPPGESRASQISTLLGASATNKPRGAFSCLLMEKAKGGTLGHSCFSTVLTTPCRHQMGISSRKSFQVCVDKLRSHVYASWAAAAAGAGRASLFNHSIAHTHAHILARVHWAETTTVDRRGQQHKQHPSFIPTFVPHVCTTYPILLRFWYPSPPILCEGRESRMEEKRGEGEEGRVKC
jgi:hypothetical protein